MKKNLYNDNFIAQYKTLQRNLTLAHFEEKVLPFLEDSTEIYWGMGAAGLHNPEYNRDYEYINTDWYADLESFVEEILFPFTNKNLDPFYMYLEVLNMPTNKEEQAQNVSACDKLLVSDYKIILM